jgi:imidazole glycerol-phosphate synthase subunit HisF
MLMPRVIPCLDVRDGRVVKGVQFQGLRDAGDPVELALAYQEQGADELVLLDVSATPEARANATETVAAVRAALALPLTVGGGVRVADDAARLLDAGADKVAVNTAAVQRPVLLEELAARFGAQCTVLAIDAAQRTDCSDLAQAWEVVTHSGKQRPGRDALRWAREAEQLGAGEILLTSWDRDGTRSGYDLDLLRAVCTAVALPVIASGGADTPLHMAEALQAGASAVLAASIFHDRDMSVDEVKAALQALGVRLRRDRATPCASMETPTHTQGGQE